MKGEDKLYIIVFVENSAFSKNSAFLSHSLLAASK
jgi:hypothetical protein